MDDECGVVAHAHHRVCGGGGPEEVLGDQGDRFLATHTVPFAAGDRVEVALPYSSTKPAIVTEIQGGFLVQVRYDSNTSRLDVRFVFDLPVCLIPGGVRLRVRIVVSEYVRRAGAAQHAE